jgi:hypothetical protein
LFPNPAFARVSLVAGSKQLHFRVFNAWGREILHAPVGSTGFDVSGWPPGVYLVEAWLEERLAAVKKLVVQ